MSQTVVIRQRPAPSWFARVGQSVRSFWNPALPLRDPALAKYFQQGESSYTGIPVTEQNAFTFSAVFDAVNQISSDVAKLPLNLLKRKKDAGSEPFTASKLYNLLKYEPNPEMGSMVFRRTLTAHALTCSGGYAEIERDGMGRPVALWPITPDRVQPFRNTGTDGRPAGPLRYRIDGKTTLEGDDVLHIHGLGYDGYVGYSVINKARQAIGLALAAERFGAEFFTSGASIGGILTSDQNYPDEDQEKQIRASMGEYQKKAGALRQFLLLFGGEWKFDPTGVKPSESQMNELRSRQVEEVARFFNMPVHKLKSLDRATFSNIEQQDLEYYKGCLLTWITLWEEEVNRKLIPSLERTQQYVKHNANAFLRGDIQSRYGAYAIALDKGLFSRNEIRDLEDMNPQTGEQGDLYLVQQAQVPLNLISDLTQSQIDKNSMPPPAPPAPPSSGTGDGEAVKAANARADAADVLARESREALARAEERLALAEASGAEKDADLEVLRAQVSRGSAALAQFDLTAAELRRTAETLTADREAALQANEALRLTLTETERLYADSVTKAIAAEERATVAESQAAIAAQEAQQAAERATFALALSEEAKAGAASARGQVALTAEQKAEAEALAADMRSEAEAARREAVDAKAVADAAVQAEQEARAAADRDVQTATALKASLESEAAARAEAERVLAETQARSSQLEADHAKAVAEAEALTVRLTEATAQQQRTASEAEARLTRDSEHRGRSLAARRDLIVDTMRRMLDREIDGASRAQATQDKLIRWSESFYDGHEARMIEALRRPVQVHLSAIGSADDALALTESLVRRHIAESRRQLQAVADAGSEDELHAQLAGLLRRWEAERVAVIPDALFQAEIDHAVSLGLRAAPDVPVTTVVPSAAPQGRVRKRIKRDKDNRITEIIEEGD